DALDGFQHGRRTDAAVAADYVGAPVRQLGPESLRARAVEAIAVFINRDLGHDGDVGVDFARGPDRLAQLVQVAEGLQDQKVHAAFHQRGNLLDERRARFVKRGFPQRLDAHAQWPYRARYEAVETFGGFMGDARTREVDVAPLVGQSVPRQAGGIGAEGVALHHPRDGLVVVVMDLPDEVRLRKVQLVVAAIDEDASGIEQRAHGAVAQDRTLLQERDEVGGHRPGRAAHRR